MMPTSPRSDVVPLRKRTKARLAKRKGARSYDEVIAELLDEAERTPRQRPERAPGRAPEEQVLLAELAERRWRAWKAEGVVRVLGPRLVSFTIRDEPPPEVQIVRPERRGFAP